MISDLLVSVSDEVDFDRGYLQNWPSEHLSLRRSSLLIDRTLSRLPLPPGEIVEIGSYKGKCLDHLSQRIPSRNCWGMDIYNYLPHPQKIIADIREYSQPHRIALGWNQTSRWTTNPRSKLAAHLFLRKNLVVGGYLIEDNLKWMPHDIEIHGFELIYEDDHFSILKKISSASA